MDEKKVSEGSKAVARGSPYLSRREARLEKRVYLFHDIAVSWAIKALLTPASVMPPSASLMSQRVVS
jgi:hypothetical protein